MAMVVLDVLGVSEKIRGLLSRRLLEVRAGLFVGSLSKRASEQLWQDVVDAEPSAAFFAYPAKNELGSEIVSVGKHQYQVVENHGIPLVKFDMKVGVKAVVV